MPDPTSRIRFSSVFPKKSWIILCKTDSDPIWVAWSGFGETHLVWKQAGVPESLCPVCGRTQTVRDRFPTFRLSSILPQTSRIVHQHGSYFVLADCVRFGPNGSGPEASQWARIIRPVLPSRSGPDGACLLGSCFVVLLINWLVSEELFLFFVHLTHFKVNIGETSERIDTILN